MFLEGLRLKPFSCLYAFKLTFTPNDKQILSPSINGTVI